MRIIGEIDHSVYKITVFQMSGKLSVKLERDLLEQTYKFRDGSGISTLADVEDFVSEDFLKEAEKGFMSMAKAKSQRIRELGSAYGEFDTII